MKIEIHMTRPELDSQYINLIDQALDECLGIHGVMYTDYADIACYAMDQEDLDLLSNYLGVKVEYDTLIVDLVKQLEENSK